MVSKIFWACGWCLWTIICYFLSQIIVVEVFSLFGLIGSNDTIINTLFATFVYAIMLGLSYGGVYLVRKSYKLPKLSEMAGLTRRINWKDLGQAIVHVTLYFCVLIVAMMALQMLLPELANEDQDVGFAKSGNDLWQLCLIFFSLVVAAPIAEELVMRGMLFGQLRSKLSFWPATILVSLLFALAHGQVNVGIDVFVLSMFLCYVREKTGAVYAPIMMHSIKNLVGFLVVFVFVL